MKLEFPFLLLTLGIIMMSCAEKDILACQPAESVNFTYGSAYIGCEMEPFFIAIGELDQCSTSLPLDSLYSTFWLPGCDMFELQSDSISADLRVSYLQSGVLEVLSLDTDYSKSPWQLILNGEIIDTGSYPYYGACQVSNGNTTVELLLLNRYIGGCFHDELIWRISE